MTRRIEYRVYRNLPGDVIGVNEFDPIGLVNIDLDVRRQFCMDRFYILHCSI
jgi:hypothetical protein